MVRKREGPKQISVKVDDPETGEVEEFILKTPTGALGWKHFRLLMEVENERRNTIKETRPDNREFITIVKEDPKSKELKEVTIKNPNFGGTMEVELPNPKLDEIMVLVMERWVTEILPNILTSHDFDEVSWDKLMLLFRAACENSSIDATNFRPDNGGGDK